VGVPGVAMLGLDSVTAACEACDRPLAPDACHLAVETADGERRAYECDCGAVTITVVQS